MKFLIFFASFLTLISGLQAQTVDSKYIEPEVLAGMLADTSQHFVIFNTGPVDDIKNAINIGAIEERKNQKKFKKALRQLPKDTQIIFYCGCCPLATCPNIQPAFDILEKMGFTNYKALNLPEALKIDWMNKGYPMSSPAID